MKKKILIAVVSIVLAVSIVISVFVIRDKFVLKNNSDTNMVDITSDTDLGYGKMYCAPIEEENIAPYNEVADYVNNEILIVVNDGTAREQVADLADKYGCEIVGEIEITGDYQLRLSQALTPDDLDAIIAKIEKEDIVKMAYPNYSFEMSETAVGDDIYYGKKWSSSLRNETDIKGKSWGIEAINAPAAWDKLLNSERMIKPVKVGIIDGGFDPNHEDVHFEQFFFENGANGYNAGNKEHGTHVAGTIGADTSDKTGIAGVYPYGTGNMYGTATGGNFSLDTHGNEFIIRWKLCLAELIVRNIKVINASLGFNFSHRETFSEWWNDPTHFNMKFAQICGEVMGEFLQKLYDAGYEYVICAGAGNDSSNIPGKFDAAYASPFNAISKEKYPDAYNRIIVVGAVDKELNIADYSNGGDRNGRNRVDIYAPGGDGNDPQNWIYSALPNNKYGYKAGTSMATPHITGIAACVWSANNSLSGAVVKEIVCGCINYKCTSCDLADASLAVQTALKIPVSSTGKKAYKCGIMCYVNDSTDGAPVLNANVTATNTKTKEKFVTTTTHDGHFELFVPAGTYSLVIEAKGYKNYIWPGKNSNLSKYITVRDQQIKYLDQWIEMDRNKDYDPSQNDGVLTNSDGLFSQDVYDFMEETDIPLSDMIVWREYNGRLYALYDVYMSATMLNYLMKDTNNVHLVTITSEEEQALVEDMIKDGGRHIYYTGGKVDKDGNLYWVTDESTTYENWYEDGPVDYNEPGYDDIMVVWRGEEYYADDDSDFGKWFEVLEDEYSFFDIFDSDLDGITRGIIVEWENY